MEKKPRKETSSKRDLSKKLVVAENGCLYDLNQDEDIKTGDNSISFQANKGNDCQCPDCQLMKAHRPAHIKRCLDTIGWYTEILRNSNYSPTDFSAHTFGLPEKYNHPDLQIVVPMRRELAHLFISNAIKLIEKGIIFLPDNETLYEDILYNGYKVVFVKRRENKRVVYRMIFPDPAGNYTGNEFTNKQYL